MKKLLIIVLIFCLSFALFANDFTGKLFEVKNGPKEYESLELQFLESEILVCDIENGTYARYPYHVSGSTIVLDNSELFNTDSIQYRISDGTAKVELFTDTLTIVFYDTGRKQYRSDLAFGIVDKATIASALIVGSCYSLKDFEENVYHKVSKEDKKFYETDKYVSRHNGEAPNGYKGGDVFKNYELRLPKTDNKGNQINYKEYDVNPFIKGVNRGAERLVRGSDGSSYMTKDHYTSFVSLY